jgi:hypothetical protein
VGMKYCQTLSLSSVKNYYIQVSQNAQHRYPSIYKFLLQQGMLICTYFSLKLHFCYNEQRMFIRSCFAKAEKYIHSTLGEVDIPTHVHLPPSQPAHALHSDHTESAGLLKLTLLSTNIGVISVHQGSQTSKNGCKRC